MYIENGAVFISDAATPYSFGEVIEDAGRSLDSRSAIGAQGHAIATELLSDDPTPKVVYILNNTKANIGSV